MYSKWCPWFERPDGSSNNLHFHLIRYDSGQGCGVLCLGQNPVVEPSLDPETLSRHRTKDSLYLIKTPRDGDLMSHLLG